MPYERYYEKTRFKNYYRDIENYMKQLSCDYHLKITFKRTH